MSDEDVIQSDPRQHARILVIDDEKDFVESLSDILTSRGYQIGVAHSAGEALAAIEEQPAQVALIDIRLGHTSGVDLINQLKEKEPALLCVMMTAYAAVDSAIESLNEGAYAYLRKPLEMRDLFATLDRCMERIQLK